MGIRVLIIDDDVETTSALRRLLERAGYEVRTENDSVHALEAAREFQPHIVILDYLMPKVHGGDAAWQFVNDPLLRHTKVIVCSGYSQFEIATKLPPSPIPILEKPVDSDALLKLIRERT